MLGNGKSVSIVINADTRPGFLDECSKAGRTMMRGARSLDFLTDGVLNKKKFFEGYEHDLTLFIDIHEPLPKETEARLMRMMNEGAITNLILNRDGEGVRKTENFLKTLDFYILNPLMMGKGRYVAHFDGDMAAFRNTHALPAPEQFMDMLEKYDYVSYPSHFSPAPQKDDAGAWEYWWVSSRFFMCEKDTLDYTEIKKCLTSGNHRYNWLEHVQGRLAKRGVFYPPMLTQSDYLIFSWSQYYSGTLRKLDKMRYSEVLKYVDLCGGVQHPCDVKGERL